MGERGKNDQMKSQKSNTEPIEADSPEAEPQNPAAKPTPKTEVRLGREAQARIGQQLRDMYQNVVHEGVPEHLADLVNRLSEQD